MSAIIRRNIEHRTIERRNYVFSPILSFAGHRIFSWRACAGLGILLGTLLLIALMYTQGQAATGGMMAVATLLSFRAIFGISRRFFGPVRLVLLEYLLITLAVIALLLGATSAPIFAGLDAWILAMTLGLAVGRTGCLMAGCCHGRIAAHGVAYPWLRWAGAPRCLSQVVFIPVQAYESALLALIFTVGLLLFSAPHQPGDILIFFFGTYGIGRFGLEFLRGDSRPYFGGLSEAQWTCIGLILSISLLALIGAGNRLSLWLIWSELSLLMIVCTVLIARHHLGPPLLQPLDKHNLEDFVETVRKVRLTALGAHAGVEGQTRQGLRIIVSLGTTVDGQLVEQYRFYGPRGPVDNNTLSFATSLARETIQDGESE